MPQRFNLTTLDEGGPIKSKNNNNLRLVCCIKGGGKLAIWGTVDSRQNIDAVLRARTPCTVECDTRSVDPEFVQYGHTHWCPQDGLLRVLVADPTQHDRDYLYGLVTANRTLLKLLLRELANSHEPSERVRRLLSGLEDALAGTQSNTAGEAYRTGLQTFARLLDLEFRESGKQPPHQ